MLAVVHKQFKEEPRGVIMASYMCGLHQQSRQCAPPGHMARTMHKHLQASQPHMMDTRCIRSTKKINREEKLHDRHRKAFIQKFRSLYEVALEYSCKSSLWYFEPFSLGTHEEGFFESNCEVEEEGHREAGDYMITGKKGGKKKITYKYHNRQSKRKCQWSKEHYWEAGTAIAQHYYNIAVAWAVAAAAASAMLDQPKLGSAYLVDTRPW